MSNEVKPLKFRPYARLLTMLGDQLIKDEKTALLELIKNSYDADADWVQVRFNNFLKEDEILKVTPESNIEIEDNGTGMSEATLEFAWMNPATPSKKDKKRNENRTTLKNRIIQGDKGIGRFSVLKLGRKIEIITKRKDAAEELRLELDFRGFDSDFAPTERKVKKEEDEEIQRQDGAIDDYFYLDELSGKLTSSTDTVFNGDRIVFRDDTSKKKRMPHGTIIRISGLGSSWSEKKLEDIQTAIGSLESPFEKLDKLLEARKKKSQSNDEEETLSGFEVDIKCGFTLSKESVSKKFADLMDKTVLNVKDGKFNSITNEITFVLNGTEKSLAPSYVSGFKEYRKQFGKQLRAPECGSFEFEFFVFDYNKEKDALPGKYLDLKDREFISGHRIYLYRDGVRVFPYGDPTDDWLQIDILRGTGRAGNYLSNDQTVGCVRISQKGNPDLEDKTSREGVVEKGNAFKDLVAIIQTILSHLRVEMRGLQLAKEKTEVHIGRKQLSDDLTSLVSLLDTLQDKKPVELARKISENYHVQYDILTKRSEQLEDLASVGLSVESTSHDFQLTLNQIGELCDSAVKSLRKREANVETLLSTMRRIRGFIEMLIDTMVGIQPIFKVARRRPSLINVKEQASAVKHLFYQTFEKQHIDCQIKEASPLVVYITESAVLQTLINLYDNSLYWLSTPNIATRIIVVEINGVDRTMRISDTGPGISKDIAPFIFEPFYSTKEEGRGLGLYVTSRLLERFGHKIRLVESPKGFSGASFEIQFSAKNG